ncbi:predicted protein [Uncinocarpus reesii 1704]|uniref:Major facilitator superfamily (MFS) profile domain-containing protein n=1 Tax=Uncinocarpus reesii (strain UAMH 1704) TaxID=336963 RepID=C4JV80_UNCRE|nr:uncharacterized protein UREG_06472 [Uncinocarpus reesii 1704]EEP81607.1 predicted protein [Uncinocarpus reesii 1704]
MSAAAHPDIRPMVIACGVSMVSIGGILGPIIGGALTEHAGWRWLLHVPEHDAKPPVTSILSKLPQKLDLMAFALFAPSCIMFLIAISWGGTIYPWGSAKVIGLLCGGLAVFTLFPVWCAYRGEEALIPFSLVRRNTVLVASLVSGLLGGASMMVGYYLPLWFQAIKGASPGSSGVMMLPMMLSQIVGSLLSAVLLRKLHYMPPWAIFGCLLGSIGAGLMLTFDVNTGSAQWIGYQVIAGFGRGIALNMPFIAVQEELSGAAMAIASSMITLTQYLAASLCISAAQAVFVNELIPAVERHAPNIDPRSIIRAGATGFVKMVRPEQLLAVRTAYNDALVKIFFIPTATAAGASFLSLGFSWKDVGAESKKKSDTDKA